MAGWMLLRDFVALLMFFVALYGFAGPEVLTRSGNWPELEVELPIGRLLRPSIRVQ